MISKISSVSFGNISTNVMEGLSTRHISDENKPIAQVPITTSMYDVDEEAKKAKSNLARNLVATLVGLVAIAAGLYFSKNAALNSLAKNGHEGAQNMGEVNGVMNKAKYIAAQGGEMVERGVNAVTGAFKKDAGK